jgi:hypothetical protein
MKKSLWIQLIEWGTFALVALFLTGVLLMRDEIIASPEGSFDLPVQGLNE